MIDVKATGSVPDLDVEAFMQAFATEFVNRVKVRTPVQTGALVNGYEIVNVTDQGFSLANNVSYFDFVENGTVNQAPVYMVRTTAEESESIAKEVQSQLVKKG